MAVYREEPVETNVVETRTTGGGDMTGYALAKYGFLLLITIVVLYFISRYLLHF